RLFPLQPLDFSNRDYVQQFRGSPQTNTYISVPVANRVSGTPTAFFSRPIRDAKGGLMGVIALGVPLAQLGHIYEAVGLLGDHGFMLARTDGTVLVRFPAEWTPGDGIPTGSPWYSVVGEGGGSFRTEGVFVSGPRLVSVRLVPDYPLVVSVGVL